MENSFQSSSQNWDQEEYSAIEEEEKRNNAYRLYSKFMFITWENAQCNLEFIFSKIMQKVIPEEEREEQEYCDNEISMEKSEFELESEQLNFEEVMVATKEMPPKCKYFIICKKDGSSFSFSPFSSSHQRLSTFYGFFYWSSRKSIRDCRKFFRVQGVDPKAIKCDKTRVNNPQNCIDFIKNQRLKIEYGTQPQEKSNKGGRPPASLSSKQQQFATSNQLMQLSEEEAWNLKPSLTSQYLRLAKSHNKFKALKDPEEKKEFQYKLYEWQEQLLEELLYEKPPERLIVWYKDSIGNSGKSSFANYLADNYPSKCLLLDVSRKVDMTYLVKPHHEWIIIDVCRAAYQRQSSSSSSSKYIKELCMLIEKLKDTRVMNSKYQSEMVKLNKTPHVVVMANFIPNLNILSKDRWNIRNLDSLNIPRKNEVEFYRGALKFENLVAKQQQAQKQQLNQIAVATAASVTIQQQHTMKLKFQEEEQQQIKRQNNSSTTFVVAASTMATQQRQKYMPKHEEILQRQRINRLDSNDNNNNNQAMDFEEEEGEEQ